PCRRQRTIRLPPVPRFSRRIVMEIPKWHEFMAPSLQILTDGEVHKARAINNAAADLLGVTAEQRAELIPSGQPRYQNRALWALSYLARAGAVDRPKRGHYQINQIGRDLLDAHSDGFTEHDLRNIPGYISPRTTQVEEQLARSEESDDAAALSPSEQVEDGIARIHAEVAADLLTRLHANDPAFFEQAVLDLLIAMGYGRAEGHASRTQLSNDGGLDGIVAQAALGLRRL